MKTFKQKVNLRSKKAMISFLSNHFRYDTMNSFNCSTSYANNVKINRLDLPREIMDKAYEMLGMEEVSDAYDWIIQEFCEKHKYEWQIGFNGRSSGYVVLYSGGLDYKNAHTARCYSCGRLTYHKENVPCTRQGCKGTLTVLEKPKPQVVTFPGKSVDGDANFEDWDIDSLRSRVKLVQEFDECCDEIVAAFVGLCEDNNIGEEEVTYTKKVKVLVPA